MKTLQILKACSIKLDDENGLIVAMSYHSEKGNRKASEYRYDAKVFNISAMKELTEKLLNAGDDETYRWLDDPERDFIVSGSNKSKVWGKFLKSKLAKMLDFDDGIKTLDGYKATKNSYNPNAKYDLTGISFNGKVIDYTSKEDWLSIKDCTATKLVDKSKNVVVSKSTPASKVVIEEVKA